MCENLEIGLIGQNYFESNEYFFKNFDFTTVIDFKMKMSIMTRNMECIQRYSFSENRFYPQMSSKRPTANVGVKGVKIHDESAKMESEVF